MSPFERADLSETDALRRRLAWAVSMSGRSQASVEGQLGVSSGHVSSLLSRRCRLVSLPLFRRLAAALRVRLAWLLCGDGPAWWVVATERRYQSGARSRPSRLYVAEEDGMLRRRSLACRMVVLGEARAAARGAAGWPRLVVLAVRPSEASLARSRRAPARPREEAPSARRARLRAELSAARRDAVRAEDDGDAEGAARASAGAVALEGEVFLAARSTSR